MKTILSLPVLAASSSGPIKSKNGSIGAPGVFPYDPEGLDGRIGFVGTPADEDIRNHYVNKRVPANLLPKGAMNPFRYLQPTSDGGYGEE